ncbi:MAG: Hydrogenase expression/formation protein HypE [Actinomycetia bacterium]|nr:Hydrogenase expression/formation protein HypE [Actinomycetes bacterium]
MRHGGVVTSPQIPTGKVPSALLGRLLQSLPSAPADVLLGPSLGEDACAIDVGGEVLLVAADPITLTSAQIGRFAVTVNANDIAVMGARPRWFLATLLLPPGTTEADVEAVFAGVRDALAETGAALVGGHSEITNAVRAPVVAGTMLGVAPQGRYVTTAGARPGDVVVQIGRAPIEGAAVLAAEARDRLGALDEKVVDAAANALYEPGINVVEAALFAADLGATAMHDPTEGGVASGLLELASASNVALRIDRRALAWFEPGRAVCEALAADPWATLASGCVLATFHAAAAAGAVAALTERGFDAALLGRVDQGHGVIDETGGALQWPARDEVARVLGS